MDNISGSDRMANAKEWQGNATNREPALLMAARLFKENVRSRDTKLKFANQKNSELEKEISHLKMKMDSKMGELQDLQDLAEKTKPAAHILETVMGELEQRNLELSSLLNASEKSRTEMESMLKEQNEELTTLRANTVIMQTLEDEIEGANKKKTDLIDTIKQLEDDLNDCKAQQQVFDHGCQEMERENERIRQEFAAKQLEWESKLVYAGEQLQEKDEVIQSTEFTIKDLFEKCNQLGTSNSDIKNELMHCLESGKHLKDLNTKLQFCKDYLEQQIEQLIKELKACKGANEQLNLEMANLSREKQNGAKQISLLEQQNSQLDGEMTILKEKYGSVQKRLKEYETGEIKCATAMAEIAKEKDAHETTKYLLEKKVKEQEGKFVLKEEELKNAVLYGRRLKTELMQVHSMIEYYQNHFIEKQELQKIKSDLEIKYKLDLNTQLQKVSEVFEREQTELISAMKTSLTERQEMEKDMSSAFRSSYRTYN